MSVLSEKGETLVESLPVYAQEDTTIRALLDAVGKELQRLDDYLSNLRATLQPQTATDEFLRYWESFLDLPVAPDAMHSGSIRLTLRYAAEALARALAGNPFSMPSPKMLRGNTRKIQMPLATTSPTAFASTECSS